MCNTINQVDAALAEAFGRHSLTWQPTDPLAELIECILQQRTTSRHARLALENLRAACADWAAVAALPYDVLVDLVRPAGLARQKAGWILGILQQVCLDTGAFSLARLHDMPTREAFHYLCRLPGVGAHTANLVLMFALGHTGVMPVDGHIHRVARRLGWAGHDASPKAVQHAVEGAAPDMDLMDLHVNLIRLGHRHCGPGKPDCPGCPVNDLCATALRQPWW